MNALVPLHQLLRDATAAAKAARVRYVNVSERGFTRRGRGKRCTYIDHLGKPLRDPHHLARIRGLVIPPAWTDVWICRFADGHIQATGKDARGRKQYRYHPSWRTVRDQAKYHELVQFGEALPRLRAKLERDLAEPTLSKTKVLATVVDLMQRTCIRVGNPRYAESNGSYGLTTLLDRHAVISGAALELRFRGKGGKLHRIRVDDARLSKIVKRCRDIPGQRLFQYFDEHGRHRAITSTDVNQYLKSAMNGPFTAKEFRTWAGTVGAALFLAGQESAATAKVGKQAVLRAVETVAAHLGNTVAICRKCYVHPAVFEHYLKGELKAQLTAELARARRRTRNGLSTEETAVLGWLDKVTRPAASLAKSA